MLQWQVALLAIISVVASVWVRAHRQLARHLEQLGSQSVETVSVIIPALNEAAALSETLNWLHQLVPAPHEIIVVDGNSEDSTIAVAKAAGAMMVLAARGRAIQMNAGARQATGDLLCFLHADSRPPAALVHIMRCTLADPGTVLAGFRTLIERRDGSLLRFMTCHHLVKSYYLVMLARPIMWLRGGLALFGDQTLFCRAADFHSVGGYDETLPIMEDVQLCITMHEAGPAAAARNAGCGKWQNGAVVRRRRGRIKQIVWPPAHTSGRRLEALGNWRATRIHFTIGLGWYLGCSRERLYRLYKTLYSDDFR